MIQPHPAGEGRGHPLAPPPEPLAEAFRAAMRAWASSVAIVAVECGDQVHGATATAVVSLSDTPPTVLVSLHTEGRTRALVACAGALSLSVLPHDAADLANRFAGRPLADGLPAADRFEGVAHHPVLDAAVSSVEGTVRDVWTHADHTVFVVEVAAARALRPGAEPLVYHDRRYRRLAP